MLHTETQELKDQALQSIIGHLSGYRLDQAVKAGWENRIKAETGVNYCKENDHPITRYGTYENFKKEIISYNVSGLGLHFAKHAKFLRSKMGYVQGFKTLKNGTNKVKFDTDSMESLYMYHCELTGKDFNDTNYKKDCKVDNGYGWYSAFKNNFKLGEWECKYLYSQGRIEIKGIKTDDVFELMFRKVSYLVFLEITTQENSNKKDITIDNFLSDLYFYWEHFKCEHIDELKEYIYTKFSEYGAIFS